MLKQANLNPVKNGTSITDWFACNKAPCYYPSSHSEVEWIAHKIRDDLGRLKDLAEKLMQKQGNEFFLLNFRGIRRQAILLIRGGEINLRSNVSAKYIWFWMRADTLIDIPLQRGDFWNPYVALRQVENLLHIVGTPRQYEEETERRQPTWVVGEAPDVLEGWVDPSALAKEWTRTKENCVPRVKSLLKDLPAFNESSSFGAVAKN